MPIHSNLFTYIMNSTNIIIDVYVYYNQDDSDTNCWKLVALNAQQN